ncbi:hypothetical protein P175DRAFT_0495424 [Aspergillus ochraceoroseus IBT 24754]|uniref:FAD-binding domain-containing protein n=2 Tax=Aspergillus ochraceoroseus TaxID=138278 RepID=A0A2T5LP16_9EURO|nr:uncharacterized protein P175DRAFT_0495424 [Aspergillus ochraceoroseus IBT 24754]KKK14466.1 hypothetical protein AOCH_003667 [Aspergillus ochraceoroseus]PTU18015.1 hypothetical protein P175DRAFT_0495424 [Aspergillus ochraceoroseus IBT 24754]
MSITSLTPVIVVGASLVALSTALCLSKHNIPTIVLERHADISKHPRAIGFTSRTLEIYKNLGIAHHMPEIPKGFHLLRARVESLTGKWYESTSWSDPKPSEKEPSNPEEKKEFSAFPGSAIPQDKLEAILQTAALTRGVDIRRQHTLQDVCEDENGITAIVINTKGETVEIRGSYLIAADGNRSLVREKLGIARSGRGHMQTMRSVLFRALTPLEDFMKGVSQFNIDQPGLQAFMTTYMDGRWVLMFHDARRH